MMVMGTTLLLLLLGLFSFLIIIITVDLKVVGFVPVVGVVARMSWRLNSSAFLSSLNDNDNNNNAQRAGPKGLRAESARAVTGRRCPHSGVG